MQKKVSCRTLGVVLKAAKRRQLADSILLAGVDYDRAYLASAKNRIEWEVFCRILRNARSAWTLEELSDLNESFIRSASTYVGVVARLLFTSRDLFDWILKRGVGGGPQLFSDCIVAGYEHVGADTTIIRLEIQPRYEPSPEFFWMTRGAFIAMPRAVGAGSANVTMTIDGRLGEFRVKYRNKRGTLSSLIRWLSWPFTARTAARELKRTNEELQERFEQLQDARATLDRQATQLRTAHTINELAQRSLELGPALDTIAKALVEQAGFAWAELELGDGSRVARAGELIGEPLLRRALAGRAGQTIAQLAVALGPDADRGEREELLEFIVPGLAIAVENAIYRSGLERLVDERTAELREARDALSVTVDQLREAQGARERFFGNISHEIRTPLSIIMLAASDLEVRAGHLLDARARTRCSIITDATRKLVRLVDELLLLAAGQEGKLTTHPEPTDLAALVSLLEIAWRPIAERAGHTLVTRIPDALNANVDPVAIERVATNLMSNAVKYTPAGGTIELELAVEDDGIRLSVYDTGPGIDQDLAARLFGRFERGANRGIGGTGLGLSLAKQLVEAHRGTVEACPRRGRGTELRVVLPAELVLADRVTAPTELRLVDVPVEAPKPIGDGARLGPSGLSRGTVLLAEDDVRLADMIASLLADEFTVIVAHDGNSALELMRRHEPQLLVTDVDMPGLDGLELSRRFREHTGDRLAPIIILSAMLDLGTRVAGLEAGATDYVSKPFDPLELKARVRAQFRMRDLALRLHRAEQLSALGILTAGLAHELRNPANGIVNAIPPLRELLPAEVLQPDHPVSQLFEVVAACAEQLNHLARQLLGFRDGGGELETRPIPVRELVERSLSLTRDALSSVNVEMSLPPTDELFSCAPPLMLQVLVNLLENAAYAAGRGGRVDLAAEVVGDKLVLEISDSGAGVPFELRERVFEPFFTTKPVGVGTGLGLSLARDIVQRHGGTLEIRERAARSAFVIELPVRHADVAAAV